MPPAAPGPSSRPSQTRRATRRQRQQPEVRQQQLIDATVRCLARHGPVGASVRTIADEAGVAVGLLRHHFGAKEQLLAAAYRSLADELIDRGEAALAAAGPSPDARLHAFLTAGFAPDFAAGDGLAARIALWSLSATTPSLRAVRTDLYRTYRRRLETLVTEAVGASVTPSLVAVLSAVLDGLWIELAAGDQAIDVDTTLATAVAAVTTLMHPS